MEYLGLTATDVIAQTAPQCFDISVWQFLTALICGARVEILPDAVTRDPRSLLRALNEKGVTILESVPSMIQAMLDAPGPAMPLPTLRWLLPTGEACPRDLCRRWRERYPHVALLNAYGPAECADDVAYHRITADDEAGLWAPLGRPVENMRLYILDRTLHPVPIGVPGELCVAGIGVGRGYLRRPDLTAAAFIPDPPTVAQLAAVVDAAVVDTPSLTLPLRGGGKGWESAGERNGPLPLSYAQRRLWFMAQLDPDDSFYHFPSAVRFTGRLDRAVVAQSINAIIRRHEALRTVFVEHDGEPAQVVLPELTVALPVEDLMPITVENREAALHRRLSEEIRLPFDLAHGPLMRLRLFVLDRGSVDHPPGHVLLLVFHHIIFDGWSFGILAREFGALYSSFLAKRPSPLPDLALQYADYAQWQRAWLQGEVLERRLNYWTERLRGSPPLLELPTGRPHAAARSLSGAEFSFTIPTGLSAGLRRLSRKQGVTLFMTLLAGFEILLYYHTGREDLVVGTDAANRSRVEIEALIGFFINLLALRVNLSGDPTFTELLARIRETTLSAYAHQDAPFDRVVEALRPARRPDSAPIFQVKLVTHNVPLPLLRLPDLELQAVPIEREITELDLVLHVFENSDAFGCVFEYRRDLFEAATIARFAEQYVGILRQAVAAPDTRLQDLRGQIESGDPARRRNRVSNSKRKGIRIWSGNNRG